MGKYTVIRNHFRRERLIPIYTKMCCGKQNSFVKKKEWKNVKTQPLCFSDNIALRLSSTV